MPELPEVETIRRQLHEAFQNAQIKNVLVKFDGRLEPQELPKLLIGKSILAINRRAKILIFKLSNDLTLIAHLKMTGRMMIKEKDAEVSKHVHVVFEMSGDKDLHWEDIRKFGWLKLMTNQQANDWFEEHQFGPEPISEDFSVKDFLGCLQLHPNSRIKSLLMNPKCIVGIGNIYVTEALWQAKIHPSSKISEISTQKLKRLYDIIRNILFTAIADQGTSFDMYYLDAQGGRGTFADKLQVYGRVDQPCLRCSTQLIKQKIAGRGTTFCPKCQKMSS